MHTGRVEGEEEDVTGFLSRLLGGTRADEERENGAAPAQTEETLPAATAPEVEGPVVVAYVKLVDPDMTSDREQMRLFALEDRVMAAISASGAGTYEGNFVDRGFFRLYASGPDAERLAELVLPLLADAPAGSVLLKRRGPTGTEEERIPVGGRRPTL